ncbi:hypothetical protein EXIGLDRAFT_725875 [Exidia glandulosa HHB12029]|uniref:BZIP domain-containing protein n=1 Tax=Exidia glandulosa HHB12029 TaxID=1314781 RepID=A0A165MGW0_EXIGL|nr:hypothetical protein EXIGLDRAFT_725875 [Exidia glandulosa HHB12029]
MAVAPVSSAEAGSFSFFSDSLSPPEPSSSSATSASPVLADDCNFFAIDPQLMAGPAQPKTRSSAPAAVPRNNKPRVSSAASIADDEDDEDEDDDDMDDMDDLIAPYKVGGRGKNARKGTVSGGIKKFGGQAVKDSNDPDDWRPTVDEYKKMTSKEKRQLRNKISARNFRVRRKEYITTLEGEVSDRDRMIDLIREELGATKLENESLRREVDALKKAMLEGRVAPNLPPPGPLDAVKAATDAATAAPAKRTSARNKSTPLARANTQKDLPSSSPRTASARAFWGGASGANAFTPVHTTLVPDFSSLIGAELAEKQAIVPMIDPSGLQENMNPALNTSFFTNRLVNSIAQPPQAAGGFDHFTDLNPFTLKNLESYRMQLWGKMAREMSTPSALNAANNFDNFGNNSLPQGLAANAKPLFLDAAHNRRFAASPPPSLAEILSGKSGNSSPKLLASKPASQPDPAMLAAVASETLLKRMTGAFWDAFSGPSPASSSKKADWDADKVRRVLEGKAVVRVVDVDDEKPALAASVKKEQSVVDPAAALEESMRALSLQRQQEPKKDASGDNDTALAGVFAGLRLGARRNTPPTRS